MKICKNFFSIFDKKEKKSLFFLLIYMIISACLESVGIGLIFPFLNILGNRNFLEEHDNIREYLKFLGIYDHVTFLYLLIFILIAWYLFKNIFGFFVIKQQILFSIKMQKKYAEYLFKYYMGKEYVYHLNNNTANLIRNIQSSLYSIFTSMLFNILFLFTEIITLLVIIVMLVLLDPVIAMSSIMFLFAIVYVFMYKIRKKIADKGDIQFKMSAEYIKWMNQGLNGIKEIKVLNRENLFIRKFVEAYSEYSNSLVYYQIASQVPRFFIEGLVTIGLLVLITVKLIVGEPVQEILSLLGLLALAAFRIMPSVNRIISLNASIKYILPTFNALKVDLIKSKHFVKESNTILKYSYNNSIDISNLSYSYDESRLVLENVNLCIPKGKFIGIIGSSGAGKTTFVDILLGLLKPSSGTIKVDGVNIFDNISYWQSSIAYVPQYIYLIDGTIRQNIALGIDDVNIDDKLINEVLYMAELYDFVNGLPEGINTNVGERGVKLSGGQRQRIGIARALYNNPEVLVLDEATSALDNETEKSITDTILKLKGKITIIAIAHRLSTLEQCDFKIKFENGKAEVI